MAMRTKKLALSVTANDHLAARLLQDRAGTGAGRGRGGAVPY